MKRIARTFAIVLIVSCMFSACSIPATLIDAPDSTATVGAERQNKAKVTPVPDGSPSESSAPVNWSLLYETVLNEYRTCIESGNFNAWAPLANYDENIMRKSTLHYGYALTDINNNSAQELILLDADLTVLAIYTLIENKPTLLCCFAERYTGTLASDGTLFTHSSDGASDSRTDALTLSADDSEFTLLGAIGMESYGENASFENPQYYKVSADGKKTIITEVEAQEAWARTPLDSSDAGLVFIPLFKGPLPEQTEETIAAAQTYLEILRKNEKGILAHLENVREYRGGQIALVDIDGDDMPELFYMKDHSEPWQGYNRSDFYVWTYKNGEALLAMTIEELYRAYGGSMTYTVTMTPHGSIYVYELVRSEFDIESFTQYTLSGGSLDQQAFFEYRSGNASYRHGGAKITSEDYHELAASAFEDGNTALLTNANFADKNNSLPISNMNYSDIAAYLERYIGLTATQSISSTPATLAKEKSIEAMILDGNARNYAYAEIFGLKQDELRLLRNGLYALSGKEFESKDLKEYFNAADWYNPRGSVNDDVVVYFNDFQKRNLELIIQIEKERGFRK